MKYRSFRKLSAQRQLGVILTGSVLMWAIGLPMWFNTASAASLTAISDTISNSAPSQTANHVVQYTSSTTVGAGLTIKVQWDPTGYLFNLGTLAFADMSVSGATLVANVGACGGGTDEIYPAVDATAPDENVTFTVCAGDTVASGTKIFTFGNTKITNPSATGSYVIRIAGTQADSGDTRVAIVDQVTMTASVDTTLTFTITGVANGATVNGDGITTSTTTTATSIGFGTLASGTPKTAAQDLSVSTNARNGFIVTVRQDQNLLSNTGADIDLFKDGNANVTPTAWTAPLATLGSEATYGHYGITSEDADLNSDEFGTALYAGNFSTSSRTIFSHNGPSDGVTANIGLTRVGFKIQVSSLQEAANDYTNRLTYVCTPTF